MDNHKKVFDTSTEFIRRKGHSIIMERLSFPFVKVVEGRNIVIGRKMKGWNEKEVSEPQGLETSFFVIRAS